VIEVTRERHVDSPVERVWELVDDVDRLPDWFAYADAAELVEGSGVGRRQRIRGRWGNKSSEVDQVVTVHHPPRLLEWEHVQERLDGVPAPLFARSTRVEITLEPDATGTTVRLRSRQVPAGPLRGLVMRALGRREVAKHMDRSLVELERALAGPGTQSPGSIA
jgi:uncharacterized protein YndB with AHSA1/START domain